MLKLIKNTAIIILAAFGVLFLILIFLPDDEEETGAVENTQIEETFEEEDSAEAEEKPDVLKEAPAEEEKHDVVKEDPAGEETDTEQKIASALEAAAKEEEALKDEEPSEEDGDAIRFTTYTLDGKKVTEDIFSGYDITVVNIWGTFCDPCIAEMGDYASLYKNLPEGVNLIGIVNDVYDGVDSNKEEAEEILNKAGAKFTNLVISDSIYDVVAPYRVIPSSFFVDSKGHILAELEGAGFEKTKNKLDEMAKK